MGKRNDFVGANMHYGHTLDKAQLMRGERGGEHSTKWQNRRPVCPYGCGEEGELLEVIMKDGKAVGIYQDSCECKFTADLQMAPKPTGRKIQIGPDGEPHMVEDS